MNDKPSRHEDPQHGWSPDVGEGGSERATEANVKAFDGPSDDERSESSREKSEEERTGVPPTDTEARSPLGVGESATTRGEEYGAEGEEGRRTLGTKGKSERPYGDTTGGTGISDDKPIDPDSPTMPPA
ncbi:hypothetical protein LWC34_50290 [Kibdelosporangium philippinense]|uniref:Uncharacterized protein n=1 Tax=Kibdelosporangium philippinense TaxID=211113 RepID=A0ABS8ZTL5_9PSEU|nr:hypothetical protein [Kibdelosporangium philippinense]MCE7010942.1 hypothetical protein [Kibdelosporangium philippinense]